MYGCGTAATFWQSTTRTAQVPKAAAPAACREELGVYTDASSVRHSQSVSHFFSPGCARAVYSPD